MYVNSGLIFVISVSEEQPVEVKSGGSVWGIRKILENPNLDLETEIDGKFKSIKSQISIINQQDQLSEKYGNEVKELYAKPKFQHVSIYHQVNLTFE